jgi:hypothetical protein
MAKQRRVWTKAEQQKETQAIRDRVDLREHAERLGYDQASGSGARVKLVNKALGEKDPMREITLKLNDKGEPSWVATKGGAGSGIGGDVFHLHQHATGQSFLETRDELRKIAFNKDFEANAQYQGMSTPERAAKAQALKEEEDIKNDARRALAYEKYKKTHTEPNSFLLARGISEQTIAETKSRTDHHGNAVFPHIREDGKFTGYERKKEGPPLYSKSERGVYIANQSCANPERIKVAEGGLDALSVYQMDTPEQRARTLYVSSAGNPAEDTALALRGLSARTGVKQIELVYDQDKAGNGHTENLTKLLAEKSSELKVADVRSEYGMQLGEDPNDLLRRTQAEQQQREALEQKRAQEAAAIEPAKPTKSQAEQAPAKEPEPEPEQAPTHTPGRSM